MSFYNLVHGTTSATFFVLPMLGKHPNEYPRFRDCFLGDEEHPEYNDFIHIYTRVGGNNREDYQKEIKEMRSMAEYVTDFDDSFDNTFATYVFKVPEKWKDDFVNFKEGKITEFSEEYKKELYRIFPKLKEKFDEMFKET